MSIYALICGKHRRHVKVTQMIKDAKYFEIVGQLQNT